MIPLVYLTSNVNMRLCHEDFDGEIMCLLQMYSHFEAFNHALHSRLVRKSY